MPKTMKPKTMKPKTAKSERKQSPKLVVQFPPEGGYTSTFHHGDGTQTVKAKAVKLNINDYDQGGDLGFYLRTIARGCPDANVTDILLDVADWPSQLEDMLYDHGGDPDLSDFDLDMT